jgi:Ca-activated chloride channel family protein
MRFQDPHYLYLLLLLPFWMLWLQHRARRAPTLRLGHESQIVALPDTWRSLSARSLPLLQALLLALALLALARPQSIEQESTVRSEGVDLMLALDLSTSMLAEDAQAAPPRKNRLTMAQDVLAAFLHGRPGDRIGLVAFAARPYSASPLTLDHAWLQSTVARLRTGDIEDGTALGDAIFAAINRLRGKPEQTREQQAKRAKHQAIVLVTDGRSNAGIGTPMMAAAAAKALGIRIHCIGIGSRGAAVMPMADPFGGVVYREVKADLDENTLREIAATTGGSYFRADDRAMLARVFQQIDRLEKAPIEEKVRLAYRELYPLFLLGALALGLVELTLRATLLRGLP